MKRQQNAPQDLEEDRLFATTDFIIDAIECPLEDRGRAELKGLQNYVANRMPLMESRYCSKDDYTIASELIKYRFVPQGHYIVRQGDEEADVYFIIKGNAKVIMKGVDEPGKYLDKKHRYNEIAVMKAKVKSGSLANQADNVGQAMSKTLNNANSNLLGSFLQKVKNVKKVMGRQSSHQAEPTKIPNNKLANVLTKAMEDM